MRAEIRPEGAPDQLCSAYLKAEWQLELGNPFNVVLMGTSGSRFPYSAVHVRPMVGVDRQSAAPPCLDRSVQFAGAVIYGAHPRRRQLSPARASHIFRPSPLGISVASTA